MEKRHSGNGYILGLGDFRRDAKKVRIETRFINKYGINKINENGENFYTATWKLPVFNNCYYSDRTSNGPCNQSGYLLSEVIRKNRLKTKLAFAHIPKYFGVIEAEKLVRKWLK